MSLKLNAAGGGSVLLQEPTTASNRTLNLPNADGTLATTSQIPSGFGFKNRIINGAFGIWQRGTSYSPGSFYLYGAADRWSNNSLNTAYARSTDVPTGFQYSCSITGSSAAYPGVTQRIESANCIDLVGQSVTISASIKKTTGNTVVYAELFSANATDNFGGLTSLGFVTLAASPTNSWVRYTATISNLPASAANGLQLSIYTFSASSSDVLLITGVQLEVGSTATSFDYRPYGTELALCQRYFAFLPTASGPGASGTTTVQIFGAHPVQMRASPTLSATGVLNISDGYSADFTQSVADVSLIAQNSRASFFSCAYFTGITTGRMYFYPRFQNSNLITLSAEL